MDYFGLHGTWIIYGNNPWILSPENSESHLDCLQRTRTCHCTAAYFSPHLLEFMTIVSDCSCSITEISRFMASVIPMSAYSRECIVNSNDRCHHIQLTLLIIILPDNRIRNRTHWPDFPWSRRDGRYESTSLNMEHKRDQDRQGCQKLLDFTGERDLKLITEKAKTIWICIKVDIAVVSKRQTTEILKWLNNSGRWKYAVSRCFAWEGLCAHV